MRLTLRSAIVVVLALGASACASMPSLPNMPSLPSVGQDEATAPERTPREHVRVAVEYLDSGDERNARAELRAALAQQPNNSAATRLMQQIEGDPAEIIGARTRAYTVRQGETMSELAQRFTGDALLFYALARFNNLDAPNQLRAGQVLQVPQRAVMTTASAAVPAAAATPSAPAHQTAVAPVEEMPAPAPPQTVNRRAADSSRAGQLRLQGLQRLNAGDVNGAVSLLRQAQSLNSADPAIQRDLDRALRMQASLRPTSQP